MADLPPGVEVQDGGARHRVDAPAARAVRVFVDLARCGPASTATVADRLGCDPGRVLDDLKMLQAMGLVIREGRGRGTRWRLRDGLLVVARGMLHRIAQEVGLELVAFLRGTALDVGRVAPPEGLPSRYRSNLARKLRVLHEPARDYSGCTDTLEQVVDALLRERTLDFDYRGVSSRRRYEGFRPLTLVVYRRALYLLGRGAEEPGSIRLSVDRMHGVRVGAPFAYPHDWSPDEVLHPWFGIFADGPLGPIHLRFAPHAAPYVRARCWHPSQRIEERPDGGVDLHLHTGGTELVRWVLEWGAAVEVVSPSWLRDRVVAELTGALSHYLDAAPAADRAAGPVPGSPRFAGAKLSE